jgi:uncharacterized protein with FMN-binding domain
MRRAPIVLVATAAGFAGVLSFHTSSTTMTLHNLGSGSSTTSTSGSKGSTGARNLSSSTPAPHTSAPTPGASARSRSSAAGAATGVRTATGAVENFGYGILAVKVTVDGSRIRDVQVATLQVAEPTSQQICDVAVPMLRSEVLAAQSAQINAISGATYTSEAYAYSLQAALDKLHVR